jgi:hypothetical protein
MAPRNGQFRVRTVHILNRRLFGSAAERTRCTSTQVVGCSIEAMESRRHFSGSPLTSIPVLNSLPGAPATIYLDFHGENPQTWGLLQAAATPAYDVDGDPTTFSTQELTNIQQIWSRVSEALSPFNINVTTVDPGNWDLDGQATLVPFAPPNNQLRVVIGGNGAWLGAAEGGAALQGCYAQQGMPNSVYVFSSALGAGVQFTADDAVHEIGHAMGLSHQSVYSGTTLVNAYNPGNGSTAPFMGNPLTTGIRATWWDGPTPEGSTVIQDDVATIASSNNGFGYRPISAGQTLATATPLAGAVPSLTASGVIESITQTDYYSFTVPSAGSVAIALTVAPYGPMLHSALELRNASNQIIQSATAGTWGQSIVTTLAAGTYYLVARSFGQYGDLGQYTVSVQLPTGPAKIAGRYLFYNDSIFDGNNVNANRLDDGALATDKQALLPGGTGQFANISSYVQGINGLMIDISNLPTSPTLADYSFAVGTSNNTSTWAPAPAPAAVLVRAAAGTGGSTRVDFTWANGSITNEWLQVTVKANADTGLAAPDVFYFGNLIGCADAAEPPGVFVVTTADLTATRQDLHGFLNPVDPTNIHDFNRDGRVDLTDEAIVKAEASAGVSLTALTPNAPTGRIPTLGSPPIFVTTNPTPVDSIPVDSTTIIVLDPTPTRRRSGRNFLPAALPASPLS